MMRQLTIGGTKVSVEHSSQPEEDIAGDIPEVVSLTFEIGTLHGMVEIGTFRGTISMKPEQATDLAMALRAAALNAKGKRA